MIVNDLDILEYMTVTFARIQMTRPRHSAALNHKHQQMMIDRICDSRYNTLLSMAGG